MPFPYSPLFAIAGFIVVTFIFMAIWASRYVKVGPNQALIISGRQHQRPDGMRIGFRIVTGGGTFVLPVIERVGVLSLEVITLEMPKAKARTAQGIPVEADCVAQARIKGDNESITAAAERFLSKNEEAMKNAICPVLEKHLRTVLGRLSLQEVGQALDSCADKVQAAAAADLGDTGLSLVSFIIRDVRGG